MNNKHSYVYIATNATNRVLYTGVTSDLIRRIHQHKQKAIPGFTARYQVNKLVYYEIYDRIGDAIMREKQIKAGSRRKKIALIQDKNPDYMDLYQNIL